MWSGVKKHKNVAAISFLLLCITALYFYPVVFSGQTFASRDMYAFFYPRQFFASECVKSGVLPLWNPHLASGVPFLANLQSSVLYPLSLIYYVLPFHVGFKYFIVLHYFLAGLWMFLLMRSWKYDNYCCVVSTVVFMFGGYMISILDNLSFLTSASWLPLAALLYDRFLQTRKPSYLIGTGVIIGLQILAGDASCYVLSTFMFIGAYHLYYIFSATHLGLREKVRSIICIPVTWLIGICLAAVVLVPFAEFVFYSTRMGGLSYEEMTKWSYHPLEIIQLVIPFPYGSTVPMCRWFGQWWLDTFYLGVFALLLVMFALWWSRNRFTRFLMLLVILSFLMAFGRYNPFFPLCRFIPGLNMIHYPVKYLFLAGFSLAILAGAGFSALSEKLARKEASGITRFLIILNGSAIGILFSGLLANDVLYIAFQKLYPQTLFHKIVGAQSAYLAIFQGYSVFVLLLAISSLLIVFTFRGHITLKAFKVMATLMLLADLMYVGRPQDALLDASDYTRSNDVVRLLKSDPSYFRIFSLAYTTFEDFMHIPNVPFARTFETLQTFMMPNLPLMYEIDTIDEYAEILVTRYYTLFQPVKEFFRSREQVPVPVHFCRTMLNMLNVKYLISSYSMNDDTLKLIRGGSVKVYENPHLLPRAFMVAYAAIFNDEEQVLRAMQERNFDPRNSVLMSREEYDKIGKDGIADPFPTGSRVAGEIKILKYCPNEVEIETIGNDRGFLVLADNYYPGWKAYVNGKKTNILRVNYNLRSIYMPAGNNTVTFSFDPLSFRIGSAITCSTLLGIVLFFLAWKKRRA